MLLQKTFKLILILVNIPFVLLHNCATPITSVMRQERILYFNNTKRRPLYNSHEKKKKKSDLPSSSLIGKQRIFLNMKKHTNTQMNDAR